MRSTAHLTLAFRELVKAAGLWVDATEVLALAICGLVAALGAPRPAAEGTAVMFRPEIDLHRATVDALEAADRSIIALPVGDPWLRQKEPRRVIAIGDRAADDARGMWPDTPRAELLTWSVPETSPELRVSAHPQVDCTATRLGPGTWTILAAEDDTGARELADALGAELVFGGMTALRAAVHAKREGKIWLRAAPTIADPVWAEYLGRVARGSVWIGADAPGLARFGLQTPVSIDPIALAHRALQWAETTHRRRKRPPQQEDAPCATT